jgi:2-polyprenyl-3-methyl-5-hydroxy-6-metoxy-1,4-benzoquinol methylase
MSRKFDNENFWNSRYRNNPELGSGPGSRGEISFIKKKIINDLISSNEVESVLDYGCGDLFCVNPMATQTYIGVDISDVVLKMNRDKFPERTFIRPEELTQRKFDLVICQDVLIHQDTEDKFFNLFNRCLESANKFFIFSTIRSKKHAINNVYYYKLPTRYISNRVMRYRDTDLFIYEKKDDQ